MRLLACVLAFFAFTAVARAAEPVVAATPAQQMEMLNSGAPQQWPTRSWSTTCGASS